MFFKEAGARAHKNALEPRMLEGRYIGHDCRTSALLVMTENEIKRGIGLRRVPPSQRWDVTGWQQLRGLPWEVAARDRRLPTPAVGEGAIAVPVVPETVRPELKQKDFYVTRADIQHSGATEGGSGCTSVVATGRALPGHAHSEKCRQRIMQLFKKDELGRFRLERFVGKCESQIEATKPNQMTMLV